jgi:hypothetical protein
LSITLSASASPAETKESSPPAAADAHFSLPEETTASPADDDSEAFSYGLARLGMSFKKWREVQAAKGFINVIKKVSNNTDPKAASYKTSEPPLENWGQAWNPIFLFSNDNGVYRLTMIQGDFPKKVAAAVLACIEKEQGKPEEDPATGSICWTTKDGKTRTLVTRDDKGGINVGLYDRALAGRWLRDAMKDMKNKQRD